jgi:hypothetical protein
MAPAGFAAPLRNQPSGRMIHVPREAKVRTLELPGVLCAALCLAAAGQAQAWTHPGIVVSQAQLDATRAAYQAGNPVIVDQVPLGGN